MTEFNLLSSSIDSINDQKIVLKNKADENVENGEKLMGLKHAAEASPLAPKIHFLSQATWLAHFYQHPMYLNVANH